MGRLEVSAVRVTEEVQLRQAVWARMRIGTGGFNRGKCEVTVLIKAPSMRRSISAKRSQHAPELLPGRLCVGRPGPKGRRGR